ncbi:helix-turn-helix domain-containing protein [Rummeliibacillus suwonensis]|uniref:helix-turn-helix domain-containing protein n=1 Tax=Rummeliibacillus suwonensis TaxID=1306154 RepID=UPI0011B6C0A2|nr:helix-turn-helix domain-containing protein [Rummeliibacillus suwonensis]MBO2535627.1 helix-turn-helix domain-containing protein [Rummeliibacillus suwonensis]
MISMNLKNLRMRHQLTQEEVAERINVSRQVIAKWEKGESTPDIQYCVQLASLYHVTLDDLVNFKDDVSELGIPPKGKHFFGVATLGERGQIVISKKAREVFELSAGDKLIIVGDDERGIALVPEKMMSAFFNLVKTTLDKGNEHDDSH